MRVRMDSRGTEGTAREPATQDVRARLAVALDVADLDAALEMARLVAPWFGVAKIGLELWAAAGPRSVEPIRGLGLEVFCDLKLHDIPTTVGRASRVIGGLGVAYVTLHASGGTAMLRAGVEGLAAGASAAGLQAPCALGVTVLTSEPDASHFDERLDTAVASGCGGVVCSVRELDRVRSGNHDLVTVVPGIRPAGAGADDQARVGTPGEVARAGGDVLVVGRPVTAAGDPADAARRIHAEVADALAGA